MKRYSQVICNILCCLSLLLSSVVFAKSTILNYQPTFIPGYDKAGNLQIALRSYYKLSSNNVSSLYFLSVDPLTFTTAEIAVSDFKIRRKIDKQPGYFTFSEINNSPYYKALAHYTSPPYRLQNYGVTESHRNGHFLTIDLCPSSKSFEKEFFKNLVKLSEINHRPTPIAIAISGLFMLNHKEEFDWLVAQEKQGKLAITWMTHSFSHAYYPDLPLKDNFLLFPHTNINFEILQTEQLLLENGQIPSVFYRFPGLVSDEQFIIMLRKYGLIPISANAGLAKKQNIKPGSIILVHGNADEPEAIKLITPQLPHLKLLPLHDIFKQ